MRSSWHTLNLLGHSIAHLAYDLVIAGVMDDHAHIIYKYASHASSQAASQR